MLDWIMPFDKLNDEQEDYLEAISHTLNQMLWARLIIFLLPHGGDQATF
jgi:hypothetical protein